MTHEDSQDSGTNENEVEEEVIEETTEDTQEDSENETKAAKSKSNVPKILAERNKYKAEAERYKSEAESKEFSQEQVQDMINAAMANREADNLKNQERNNFLETYGEENL